MPEIHTSNGATLQEVEAFARQTRTLYAQLNESANRAQHHNPLSPVKFSAAYKEARNTYRQLRALYDRGELPHEEAGPLLDECAEILRMIGNAPGRMHKR